MICCKYRIVFSVISEINLQGAQLNRWAEVDAGVGRRTRRLVKDVASGRLINLFING